MRVHTRSAAAALCLSLSIALPARAERPQTREGFWIGFGLGYGSAGVSCDGCDPDDREGAFTGLFKLGGTLRSNVLLGVEANVWTKEQDGDTLNLGNVSAAVYYYPVPSSGLHLKGGLGTAVVDGDFDVEAAGWGLLAGVGYDVRIGRNISLTPAANFYFGRPGELKVAGTTVARGWKQNVFDLTIGLTFH